MRYYQKRKLKERSHTSMNVGAAAPIEHIVTIIPSNTFWGFGRTAGKAGLKTAITTPEDG